MYFHRLFTIGTFLLAAAIIGYGGPLWALWMAAIAVYCFIQRTASRFPGYFANDVMGAAVLMQTILALAAAVLSNHSGTWLIAFGLAANFAVIAVNGFRMPYIGDDIGNPCYVPMNEAISLAWLGDIFPTTMRPRHQWLVSPGDALEIVGIWVLAAELVLS